MFSPWYRWSGRKNPEDHVCINVATYGKGGRWTMTDRGQAALRQSRETFEVGPSKLTWTGQDLHVDIDELAWPRMHRLKGRITVHPTAITDVELPLKADGSHVWRPFAPSADITVDLNQPGWQWAGHGYFDANFGTAALEDDFRYWTWARFPSGDNGAYCFYDADLRDGSELAVGMKFHEDGRVDMLEDLPPRQRMRRSLWTVRREMRSDAGFRPYQDHGMLDAPFYCRSAVKTRIHGEETLGVHEALDLDRFATKLIKPMLACRVPRRAGWKFG